MLLKFPSLTSVIIIYDDIYSDGDDDDDDDGDGDDD